MGTRAIYSVRRRAIHLLRSHSVLGCVVRARHVRMLAAVRSPISSLLLLLWSHATGALRLRMSSRVYRHSIALTLAR